MWTKITYRHLTLDLKSSKQHYNTPDLPKSLKAININLGVANPEINLDATTVDLSQFHFEMASNPFDLKVKVKTPIQMPLLIWRQKRCYRFRLA